VIYADYNAGAPLLPEVAALLSTLFTQAAGNASSVHQVGRSARRHLDQAREQVAAQLGCLPREVTFTGSGSEAAAIAIAGVFRGRVDRARVRLVSSAIEHPCVLGTLSQLEREGAQVVRLAPDATGRVPLEALDAALTPDTLLCSLQWVNNETGVVQPAPEVSRLCTQRGVLFHTDAVQALGRLPASLREVPADLFTFSAHKLGGPTGVGCLFARRELAIAAPTPGHQENGRRGGTQSPALARGLSLALELAVAREPTEAPRLTALRDAFEREVQARLPFVSVNGAGAPRVGATSSLCFHGHDGEALLIALDLAGVCVSTSAACASGSLTPSHVLRAMGRTPAQVHATLRLSFGHGTTEAELAQVLETLTRVTPACREA
jgi:cysteine desulfurase